MIIVTGGSGFIGSVIIWELNNRAINDILVVDQLGCDQKWKNLRNLKFTDYLERDVFLEMVRQNAICKPIEAVFHMGACSSTTETNASYLLKNNYEYTKILAQWAVDSNIRFVYASSAATYGNGSNGFDDEHETIDSLQPLNMYGYSKQLFDSWAKRAGMLDKIVGLKYFNVFGPNEYHKADMRSFCLKAFEQIVATGKVELFKSHDKNYADGEYLRDFIYVKDVVDMTLFFMDNPQANGLFNIGTGKAQKWNDLAKAVFAAMDKKADIKYIKMPKSIRNQYQYFTEANVNKLLKAGYNKQATSLKDSIADYVQNYLQKESYLASV